MWLLVHLTFMTGFKNRFTAMVQWAFSFIGHGRAERALPRSLPVFLTLATGARGRRAVRPLGTEGEPSS